MVSVAETIGGMVRGEIGEVGKWNDVRGRSQPRWVLGGKNIKAHPEHKNGKIK